MISFEDFTWGPDTSYPTFSICLSDSVFRKGDLFNSSLLDPYNISKSNYLKYLVGESNENTRFRRVDYENIIHRPEKLIIDFHTRDRKHNEFNTWTTPDFVEKHICNDCSIVLNRTLLEYKIGTSEFPFFVYYFKLL